MANAENSPLLPTKEIETVSNHLDTGQTDPVNNVSKDSTKMCGPEREDEKIYRSGEEIQGNPTLEKKLNEYKKFHDYRILNPHDGEKVNKGLRVVRKDTKNKDLKAGDLGSIDDVKKNGEVFIKWDKHDNKSESFHTDKFNQYKLLLFDNAQADVEHEDFTCDGCRQDPLHGIRWKCLTCADYDLCTKCYIINKHNVDHIFKRFVSPNSKGVEMPPRKVKKIFGRHDTRGKTIGSGILKFSEVEIINNVPGLTTKTGIVQKYNENRSTVFVKLNAPMDTEEQEKKITELKLKDGGNFSYYPEHLPVLVQSKN